MIFFLAYNQVLLVQVEYCFYYLQESKNLTRKERIRMPQVNLVDPLQSCRIVAAFVFSISAGWAISLYLNIQPQALIWLAFSALVALSLRDAAKETNEHPRTTIWFAALSFFFTLSLIAGEHIVLGESGYSGLTSENYISTYGFIDLFAFILMWPSFCLLFLFGFRTTRKLTTSKALPSLPDYSPLGLKTIGTCAIAIFICWLPYLFLYWPGLIFGDSLSSLAQATGNAAYSNHHPFLYTIFIKCCLWLGGHLGMDAEGGVAIYSLLQMAFMAWCLSYLSIWICKRTGLGKVVAILGTVVFALCPYVATFSISMWKDPAFSVAIAVLSLLIFDLITSKGNALNKSRLFLPGLIAVALIAVFSRNNGVYVVALTAAVLLAWLLFHLTGKRKTFNNVGIGAACFSMVLVVAFSFVVTGPVYKAIGVAPSPKVEGIGILVNQMARVAAHDGDMTESDREYMNALLPLEMYKTTYRPCCTDLLKWDPSFNNAVLENGFFGHWISMFTQNPMTYVQSWELQTFGFWTVNRPECFSAMNTSWRVPRNTTAAYQGDLDAYGIDASVGLNDDFWHNLFPHDATSIPIGLVFWFMLYLTVCLVLLKKKSWILAILPSLGVLATMVIASPIWYWPRYGAAAQFLIPFYIALGYMAFRDNSAKPTRHNIVARLRH